MPNGNVKNSTDVANQALGHIGWTDQLTDISDQTPEGTNSLLFYGQARDEVLTEYDWPFAIHHAQPPFIDPIKLENKVVPQNWRFALLVPLGCLKLHGIYRYSHVLGDAAAQDTAAIESGNKPDRWNANGLRIWHRDPDIFRQVRYTREQDANLGQLILTDCTEPVLEYLSNTGKVVNGEFVEDVTQWDADFVRAVALRLASYLAGPLKKDAAMGLELYKASRDAGAMATARAAQEVRKDPDPLPLYMQMRRWGGSRRGGGW